MFASIQVGPVEDDNHTVSRGVSSAGATHREGNHSCRYESQEAFIVEVKIDLLRTVMACFY